MPVRLTREVKIAVKDEDNPVDADHPAMSDSNRCEEDDTLAWPVPIPVHANSSLLPILFSTSCDMDAPCLPSPEPKSEKFNATRVDLNGTMCFSLDKKPPCIWLQRILWCITR